MKPYFVYIMSNHRRTVLYTGVTNHLETRVQQHKNKDEPNSFTAKYNCNALVYFEEYKYISEAIYREKQIKGWKRFKKENLITALNPELKDLSSNWN